MKTTKCVIGLTLLLAGLLSIASRAQSGEVQWSRNLCAGYKSALEQHKPLVVYFSDDNWWPLTFQDAIKTGTLNEFASRAVFVRAEPKDEDDKGNYAKIKSDLQLDQLPTVSVLDVGTSVIKECGRIVG